MRFAVVGHVEWITFLRVAHLPLQGGILQAQRCWDEVGGGGAVAAVQVAKLAGHCDFFTALGDDELGHRSFQALEQLGVTVHAAWRPAPQRRGIVFIDDQSERSITVIGQRLVCAEDDPLPFELLDQTLGCYYTGGAAQQARRAQSLVATTRVRELLGDNVPDLWVGSRNDPRELVEPETLLAGSLSALVLTEGGNGGRFWRGDRTHGRWSAAPLPGPPVDSYGCGDSFAGALAFATGSGHNLEESLALAARCGAACLTGSGPYSGQLDVRERS